MEFRGSKILMCLAIAASTSIAWGRQPTRTLDGTYDVRTIKEVTSTVKIAQVCLEDIETVKGKVTQTDFIVCDCVILELMKTISYGEYWEIEQNILYGRDWKNTGAMRKAAPQLSETCNWAG